MGKDGVKSQLTRNLDDFDVFVRDNNAYRVIKKIQKFKETTMTSHVHSRNTFSLPSNYRGHKDLRAGDYLLLSSNGFSYIKPTEISIGEDILNSYKVIITYAMSGGNKPSSEGNYQVLSSLMILKPKEVCTETFLILDRFTNEKEAIGLASYAKTKFFRYLLLQSLSSIHITKDSFRFVPLQDFTRPWTDADLYAKYNLTDEEIQFIESMIKPMD